MANINDESKQILKELIECEGLDYALTEYSQEFIDSGNAKLIKLVKGYNKIYRELADYLREQGILDN